MPPTSQSRSSTVTGTPNRANSTAAVSPAGPPPMTTARFSSGAALPTAAPACPAQPDSRLCFSLHPSAFILCLELCQNLLGAINSHQLIGHHAPGHLFDQV